MVKLELRVEYTAHEITANDFDMRYDAEPHYPSRIPGLIYRGETRTVRMMTDTEHEDEEYGDRCDKRPAKRRDYETPAGTAAPPGPCSYYGIGCWIVCKNGKPIAIMSKQKLAEIYRIAP